jgi:hypothetical protein
MDFGGCRIPMALGDLNFEKHRGAACGGSCFLVLPRGLIKAAEDSDIVEVLFAETSIESEPAALPSRH